MDDNKSPSPVLLPAATTTSTYSEIPEDPTTTNPMHDLLLKDPLTAVDAIEAEENNEVHELLTPDESVGDARDAGRSQLPIEDALSHSGKEISSTLVVTATNGLVSSPPGPAVHLQHDTNE